MKVTGFSLYLPLTAEPSRETLDINELPDAQTICYTWLHWQTTQASREIINGEGLKLKL